MSPTSTLPYEPWWGFRHTTGSNPFPWVFMPIAINLHVCKKYVFLCAKYSNANYYRLVALGFEYVCTVQCVGMPFWGKRWYTLKAKVWYLADAFIQNNLYRHPTVASKPRSSTGRAATLTTVPPTPIEETGQRCAGLKRNGKQTCSSASGNSIKPLQTTQLHDRPGISVPAYVTQRDCSLGLPCECCFY